MDVKVQIRIAGNSLVIAFAFNFAGRCFIFTVDGIYISAGSACSASRKGVSRVMEAFGLPKPELESAVRISFGEENTEEECVYAAKRIAENAKRLKR